VRLTSPTTVESLSRGLGSPAWSRLPQEEITPLQDAREGIKEFARVAGVDGPGVERGAELRICSIYGLKDQLRPNKRLKNALFSGLGCQES
jgi:hypothetical protein